MCYPMVERRSLSHTRIAPAWHTADGVFYGEKMFQELLLLERKRAKRSGQPFILARIDISGTPCLTARHGCLDLLISQLHTLTRETDIKGWYSHENELGMLFTETGTDDEHLIFKTITNKLHTAILYAVGPHCYATIAISVQRFPDAQNTEPYKYIPDYGVYPELDHEAGHSRGLLFLKRGLDVTGSMCALILCLPLFLLTPLAIKLTSRGSVLSGQERAGKCGQKFILLKFRTTESTARCRRTTLTGSFTDRQDDEIPREVTDDSNPCTTALDQGITRIGRFLRATRLDRLPQFLNVLKGDMSLVGPQSPILSECSRNQTGPSQSVMQLKPGITGLGQLQGQRVCSLEEMVWWDLKYIREWSLGLDLKILLRAPWALITDKYTPSQQTGQDQEHYRVQ